MELVASELIAGFRAIIEKEMETQLNVRARTIELEESMEVLRSKLHGLRKEKIRDLDILKWIDTLENIMYDADDVLDDFHLRDSELGHLSEPPTLVSSSSVPVWRQFPLILTYVTRPYQFYFNKLSSNHDIGNKLQALNSRLQMLKTQRDNRPDLQLLDKYQGILPRPVADREAYAMPSMASSSFVVGATLRNDADFMVRLLLNDHDQGTDNLPVYAIVGPGGIGKTTMANLILESLLEEKKHGSFDLIIGVTVTRKFDKLNLLKRIITAAAGSQWAEGDLFLLGEAVKKAIQGKKLLLLLDDVWDAMDLWNLWLGVLFRSSSCAPGSRVLITTRNREAADQMKAIYSHSVQPLTGNEGWELLCRCVGGSDEAGKPKAGQIAILKTIGEEEIVEKKCYGNPLAIMSMGGMLCLENKSEDAWRRILVDADDIWSKGLLNLPEGIHKDIYCVFDDLPSAELRHCFVYCSLFPLGYQISCSDIIEMWVAEGIVQDDEAALGCFEHLIRSNVLIPGLSPEFSRTCKMDGLSCSLGRFIMKGGGLVITQKLPLPPLPHLLPVNQKNKLRRLSLVIGDGNAFGNTVDATKWRFEEKIHVYLKKQPSLRTLLLFNHPLQTADKLLHHLPSIRLLSLRKAGITKLPDSIGSLVHLRLLDVSENEKMEFLPESIGKLANLKSLRLQSCKELAKLPKSFLKLKELMYFDARETSIECLPEGIGQKMPKLRKITPLRLNENGKELATMLKEMENLRSLELEISWKVLDGLPGSDSKQIKNKGVLESKKHLRELVLRWKQEEADSGNEKKLPRMVRRKLSPPTALEDLRIIHYHGSSLPHWLSLSSASRLPNLKRLQLESCLNLKVIYGLGELPCLEHLLLKQAPKVTFVRKKSDEITLQEDEESEMESSSSSSSSSSHSFSLFPKLKVLHFEDMAEWEKWEWPKMESRTSMELPSLHTLSIRNCPKLKSIPEGLLFRSKMLRRLIIDESPELIFDCSESFPSFLEIKINSQSIHDRLQLWRINRMHKYGSCSSEDARLSTML